jgi:uncharacterized protein (TIGR03066 family)
MPMRGLALAAALLALGQARAGDTPEDKTKPKDSTGDRLVGTWEVTQGAAAAGSTVAFAKDGTFQFTVRLGEGTAVLVAGTYQVGDNQLTLVRKTGSKGPKPRPQVFKIKELTDKGLVTADEKGRATTFKKVK